MLFCWVAASVAIKVSILLPLGLGCFWILLHSIESHQRPKMSKLCSFFSYLSGKVQITKVSCFPALLARALSKLAGKLVSTSQGSSKVEGVHSAQQSDISMLTWVFFFLAVSIFLYLFFPERLDLASMPTWIVVLFLTFAFLSGWRGRRLYKQSTRCMDRVAQGNHIEAAYEKAALTKKSFKEETTVKLKQLFSLQCFG